MYLILLLVVFLLLGFLLSKSKISGNIDRSAKVVTGKTRDLAARYKDWLSVRLGSRRKGLTFIHWVKRNGGNYFSEEFTSWLNEISEVERQKFVTALGDFMQGLGYDLKKFDDGSLDNKPSLLQIYVEAVVIYSNAYRKAKQAQKEAEKTKQKTPSNGKQMEGENEATEVVNLPEIAEPVPAG